VATFRADVTERIPALATGGLAEVLGTLHETLAWRGNSLERSWRTGDCSLDGRGVQLLPSGVWTGPPLFADHLQEVGGNVLIYAARPPVAGAEIGQHRDLAGLLGHTRAAVLRALRPRAAPRNWRPASAPARHPPPSTPPRCAPPAWCRRCGGGGASTIH